MRKVLGYLLWMVFVAPVLFAALVVYTLTLLICSTAVLLFDLAKSLID